MSSLPFDALFAPGAEADLLGAVLDNMEEGIVVCDAQGAVRYFNRSTRRMLGLPERPLPPERWQEHYELFAADGVTPLRPDQAPLWRALHEGEVRDTEIVIVPRTGLPQAVIFNGSAVFGPNGKLGAVVRMHNVTEARALSREREGMQVAWLSAVLTSVEEGIIAADANGNVVECNAAALAMHDFEGVEQARRHLGEYPVHFELRTPEGETLPVDAWPMARALRGETFAQLELRVRRFDRPWEKILAYSGTTIRSASGNVSLALLTIRDVTARRRAEHLLAQSQRQMELVVKGANVVSGTALCHSTA